jgi:hypothetical protein
MSQSITMAYFSTMTSEQKTDFLAHLYRSGILPPPIPEPFKKRVEEWQRKEDEIRAKGEAQAKELQQAHSKPDWMFPHLFTTNPIKCRDYIAQLKTADIEVLINKIRSGPRQLASIFDYRPEDAIDLLQIELTRRQIQPPHSRWARKSERQ